MRNLIWLTGLGAACVLLSGCAVSVGGTGEADPAAVYQLLHGPLSTKQVFDDYQTADPCSLVNLKQLPSNLSPKLLPAQSLDYCAVQVHPSGKSVEVDLGELEPVDALNISSYQSQTLGRSVSLLKDPHGDQFCDDYLKFSDNVAMAVDGYDPSDDSDSDTGLCDAVETVAQTVYKTVSTPETVKHRTFPDKSLGKVDACSLISADAVGSAESSSVSVIKFPAQHECEYRQSASSGQRVWIQFIVDKAPSPSESGDTMQTISGHDSLVSSFAEGGFATCSVETKGIPFQASTKTGGDDGDLYEIAEIYADDDSDAATQDCQVATKVAQSAWQKLPSS